MTPETVTAKALLALKLPPPVYVVPELIPEGLLLLAGRPKLGKSWFALNLAVAVASGGRALGKIEVEAAGVLFCALEDSHRRLQDRLETVLGTDEPPENLHFTTALPRLDEGGLNALDEFLAANESVKLVVIDTLTKVEPLKKQNGSDYQDTTITGAALQRLALGRHVAVLCVYHTRKAASTDFLDEVLGSTGLTGSADSIMVLSRSRGEADATLSVTGRDIEEASLALEFDPQRCLWHLLGDAERFTMSKERRNIITLIEQSHRPLAPKEIAKALNKKPGAVRFLLHKMVRNGQLASSEGSYSVKTPNTANTANADGELASGTPIHTDQGVSAPTLEPLTPPNGSPQGVRALAAVRASAAPPLTPKRTVTEANSGDFRGSVSGVSGSPAWVGELCRRLEAGELTGPLDMGFKKHPDLAEYTRAAFQRAQGTNKLLADGARRDLKELAAHLGLGRRASGPKGKDTLESEAP